jgi:hypothetical protein
MGPAGALSLAAAERSKVAICPPTQTLSTQWDDDLTTGAGKARLARTRRPAATG